jgi:hypothetical protein
MEKELRIRLKSSHIVGVLAISLLSFVGVSVAAQVGNNAETGYVICINKSTKVVTYPGTLSCPKGTSSLVIGARGLSGRDGQSGRDGLAGLPGLPGLQGVAGPAGASGRDGKDGKDGKDGIDGLDGLDGKDSQQILQSLLPTVLDATYRIECDSVFSTGTGIEITLSTAWKNKGYKGALVTSSDYVLDCEDQIVEVTQEGVSVVGIVSNIDTENRLALVLTKSVVNFLKPAEDEPIAGSFVMSLTRGGGWPEGTTGIGILNSLNPTQDEEINSIQISGRAMESSAPVINALGEYISIGQRKPGVLCRTLLTCDKNSSLLNWSS